MRNLRAVAAAVALVAVVGLLLPIGPAAPSPAGRLTASSTPVTGNVTGPTVLAWDAHSNYYVNGTGGPAFAPNGTQVGNLTWYASLLAANLTGISLSPTSNAIVGGNASLAILTVGNISEPLTIAVMLSSVYQTDNVSINFTYTLHVVQPYVVAATLVCGPSAGTDAFQVVVDLDGAAVGSVTVPSLLPNGTYHLSFKYAVLSLASGWHTFTVSLAALHGLVRFSGGATVYSQSFYVPGPATSYTLWYVAGFVAFFGVLFILLTRVAARRRGAVRR